MLLILGSVFVLAAPANAYALNGCKWPASVLNVNTTGVSGGKWSTAIGTAFNAYFNYTDVSMTPVSYSGPTFVAQSGLYGNTGLNGSTTWNCVAGTNFAATMQVNESAAEMAGGSSARVALTWQHEMGHALGIDHVSTIARVMYGGGTQAAWNAGVTILTTDDRNGINALY